MAKKALNGTANCILEVCCLAAADGSASQSAIGSLATLFREATSCDPPLTPAQAIECATMVYMNFDLAERGSLSAFKASVARVAKNEAV